MKMALIISAIPRNGLTIMGIKSSPVITIIPNRETSFLSCDPNPVSCNTSF